MPPLEIFFMTNVDFVLIDDSPLDIFIAQNIIDRLGLQGQVWSFENGKEALDFLSAQPRPNPTLIFVDIQMPTMDGFETITAIRKLGLNIPVIALTGSANQDERDRLLAMGVNDYIIKPYHPHQLHHKLTQLLKKQ